MNGIQQFVQALMQENPGSEKKEMLQAVLNNDTKKGEEIAMNLCNTYGVSKEQAIQMSQQWAQSRMAQMRGRGSRFF